MRLSDGVEWGLHCAVLLAALGDGGLPGRDLAAYHGVSESYLLKHLQALTRAGLLESVSGPRGGYRLARPAAEMTVLDVVEAIEGRQPAFRCSEIRQRGPGAIEDGRAYRRPCPINATMLAAEAARRDALRARTIADLLAEIAGSADPRALERGAVWLGGRIRR